MKSLFITTLTELSATPRTALALGCIAVGLITPTEAATIDLRAGFSDSGTINGAIYRVDTTHPAGTGIFGLPAASVFETIQEVQGNPNNDPNGVGVQEGYNTSLATVMDTGRVPQWNHEIQVSDLTRVVINGLNYVPFLLDINEAAAANKSLLTLDDVQIMTSATLVGDATLGGLRANVATTIRYEMDLGENSWVLLDYNRNGGGSGTADMGLFVPESVFGGVAATDYVYLYSRFGGDDASAVTATDTTSHSGFEEWTLGAGAGPDDDPEGPSIPEPSTSLLGILGVIMILRRRMKQ